MHSKKNKNRLSNKRKIIKKSKNFKKSIKKKRKHSHRQRAGSHLGRINPVETFKTYLENIRDYILSNFIHTKNTTFRFSNNNKIIVNINEHILTPIIAEIDKIESEPAYRNTLFNSELELNTDEKNFKKRNLGWSRYQAKFIFKLFNHVNSLLDNPSLLQEKIDKLNKLQQQLLKTPTPILREY